MTIEAEICTRFGDAEVVGGDSCLGASMRMLTEVAVVFSPLVVFAGVGVVTHDPWCAFGAGMIAVIVARVIVWMIGMA